MTPHQAPQTKPLKIALEQHQIQISTSPHKKLQIFKVTEL